MSKEAMRLALEALEMWCPMTATYLNTRDKAITAIREALANEALDKMAENARELGLDYEPAQQEPVAYLVDDDLYYPEEIDWETLQEQGHTVAALYTSPPASKPLTDEQILAANYPDGEENGPTIAALDFELICFARQIEAKLREKNNG